MSTKADQLGERGIVTGRAYVRMVEVADVLLDRWPERRERSCCNWCGRYTLADCASLWRCCRVT
jgi:hypothetical protein